MITKNYALLLILSVTLLLSCSDTIGEDSTIYGKYRMFSNDPAVNRFLFEEDNYIQVNEDKTVIYNTTINTKPKFNFKGEYTYDNASNTLQVKWSEGKLPDQLKIEVVEGDQIIKIGETSYKKEKTKK